MFLSPAVQRAVVILIVVVLCGLPFLALMMLQRSRPGEAGSTLNRNTRGAQSLFRLAELHDLDPIQRKRAVMEPISAGVAQIWIVQPAQGLEAKEVRHLLEWVTGGGTIILVSKNEVVPPYTTMGPVPTMAPLTSLIYGTQFEQIELDSATIDALTPLAAWADVDWELPTIQSDVPQGLPVTPAIVQHPLTRQLPPMLAVPFARGEDWQLQVLKPGAASAASGTMQPLLTTAAGAVMGEFTHGTGRVVVLTQTEWVTNALLPGAPCAELSARLLAYRTRVGSTVFLEHLHGHTQALRNLRDLMGASWGRLALWIGLVLVLAIASAGVRFVAPLAQPPAPRPEPGDYVEALGRLYSRAQAWEAVPYNLLAYFRHQARFIADHTATPTVALARRRRSARIAAALEAAPESQVTPRMLQDLLIAPEMDSTAP